MDNFIFPEPDINAFFKYINGITDSPYIAYLQDVICAQDILLTENRQRKAALEQAQTRQYDEEEILSREGSEDNFSLIQGLEGSAESSGSSPDISPHTTEVDDGERSRKQKVTFVPTLITPVSPIPDPDFEKMRARYIFVAVQQAFIALKQKKKTELKRTPARMDLIEAFRRDKIRLRDSLFILYQQPLYAVESYEKLHKVQSHCLFYDDNAQTKVLGPGKVQLFENLFDLSISPGTRDKIQQEQMLVNAIAHYNIRKKLSVNKLPQMRKTQNLPPALEKLNAKLVNIGEAQFKLFKKTFEDILFHDKTSFLIDLLNVFPKSLLEKNLRSEIDPDLHDILISFIRNDDKGYRVGSELVRELYETYFNKSAGNSKEVRHCIRDILLMSHQQERAYFKDATATDTKLHKSSYARSVNRLCERYNYKLRYQVENLDLKVTLRESVSLEKITERRRKPHVKRTTHMIALFAGLGACALTIGAMLATTGLPVVLILLIGAAGGYSNYVLFNSFAVPFFVRLINKGLFTKEGVFNKIAQQFREASTVKRYFILMPLYALLAVFMIGLPLIMFFATTMSAVASFSTLLPPIVQFIVALLPVIVPPVVFAIIRGITFVITLTMAFANFILYVPLTIFSLTEFPAGVSTLYSNCKKFILGEENSSLFGKIARSILLGILLPLGMAGVAFAGLTTIRGFGHSTANFFMHIPRIIALIPARVIGMVSAICASVGRLALNETSLFNLIGRLISRSPAKTEVKVEQTQSATQDEKVYPWAQDGIEPKLKFLHTIFNFIAVCLNGCGNGFLARAGASHLLGEFWGKTIAWFSGSLTSICFGTLGMSKAANNAALQEPCANVDTLLQHQFRIYDRLKSDGEDKRKEQDQVPAAQQNANFSRGFFKGPKGRSYHELNEFLKQNHVVFKKASRSPTPQPTPGRGARNITAH